MFQVHNSNTDTSCTDKIDGLVFIDILKKKWDILHQEPGVFRYQIDILRERVVDDKYLIQLNTNRGTKRRAPEKMNSVIEPFDDEKFNFTKVSDKEIMFTLTKNNDESNKHAILVNVSPINRYHSLLCPSIDKRLPQVITEDSLKLALDLMLYIEDRSLKIGFNSLCGMASVNHLPYHLFLESRTLPVEIVKCKHIKGALYVLDDYVVPAFSFDVSDDVDKACRDIFKLLRCLLRKCIAHNVLMAWREDKIRVYVWPRRSCEGVKNLAAFNVAVCELAGWFPVYDADEFTNIQREDLEEELIKWKYDKFDELFDELKSIF